MVEAVTDNLLLLCLQLYPNMDADFSLQSSLGFVPGLDHIAEVASEMVDLDEERYGGRTGNEKGTVPAVGT